MEGQRRLVVSSCAVELPLLFYDEECYSRLCCVTEERKPFEGTKFLNRRNERNGSK